MKVRKALRTCRQPRKTSSDECQQQLINHQPSVDYSSCQPEGRRSQTQKEISNVAARTNLRKRKFSVDYQIQKRKTYRHSSADQPAGRKDSLQYAEDEQTQRLRASWPSSVDCQPPHRRKASADYQTRGRKYAGDYRTQRNLLSSEDCHPRRWKAFVPSTNHRTLARSPSAVNYHQTQGNFHLVNKYRRSDSQEMPNYLPSHDLLPQRRESAVDDHNPSSSFSSTSHNGHLEMSSLVMTYPPKKIKKSLNAYLTRRRKKRKNSLTTKSSVPTVHLSGPDNEDHVVDEVQYSGTSRDTRNENESGGVCSNGSATENFEKTIKSPGNLLTDFQIEFISSVSPDTKIKKKRTGRKRQKLRDKKAEKELMRGLMEALQQDDVMTSIHQLKRSHGLMSVMLPVAQSSDAELGSDDVVSARSRQFPLANHNGVQENNGDTIPEASPENSSDDEDIENQLRAMVEVMSPGESSDDDVVVSATSPDDEEAVNLDGEPSPAKSRENQENQVSIPATSHLSAKKEATSAKGEETEMPTKKSRKKKSKINNVECRGLNGWEQSLRQRPKTVVKYQGTFQRESMNKKPEEQSLRQRPKTVVKYQGTFQRESMNKKPEESAVDKHLRITVQQERKKAVSANTSMEDQTKQLDVEDKLGIGELVWGKIKGYPYWPAQVVSHIPSNQTLPSPGSRWVRWFGDGKYSQVKVDELLSFGMFGTHYQASYTKKYRLYHKALYQILTVCAARAKMDFPSEFTERPITKRQSLTEQQTLTAELIHWAEEGFQPRGADGLAPSEEERQPSKIPLAPAAAPLAPVTGTSKMSKTVSRQDRIEEVRAGKVKLEDVCISCGSVRVTCCHPLFIGGLCDDCKVEFIETSYLFDNDGYQSYCCVCCAGNEVLLCGNSGCYRSFCFDCVKLLVGSKILQEAIKEDAWICYMCRPNVKTQMLCRRNDWPEQLVQMFKNDRVQDFEPFRSYVAPPLIDRRPIRVLALFDGIGTGLLALKELGFQIDCYLASEVNEDAIKVATVRHAETIVKIGDVKNITKKQIEDWGPFDLVMGGSPCNDLSIVNPARKGLFGTGRLFFEFHRILSYAKPAEGNNRPFFWFLENVCFMEHTDKMDISRFLECNPVIVDAKDLSPAHRARYFWGNLPGMDRPNVATGNHNLSLQECLEPNCDRKAQFKKIRTITTKPNSIKQSKEKVLPVLMNGKEDGLWCTEMERLFGFPEHYTDVSNMGRIARQRLLGRAWSVPVIKHLLAPLKDFYACNTL